MDTLPARLSTFAKFALPTPSVVELFLSKQSHAYHSHVCPFLRFIVVRAIRLELLERLDGLASAGKHTEDVEADLQSC
jgi:hypothetical protein